MKAGVSQCAALSIVVKFSAAASQNAGDHDDRDAREDIRRIVIPHIDSCDGNQHGEDQHRGTDAFVFVTPEYNYTIPPALVNALDTVYHEWTYKPVGFVSYGGVSGGLRAVQTGRLMVTGFKMMPMVEAVNIPFFTQLVENGVFKSNETHDKAVPVMLDELLRWTNALKVLRAG